MNITEAIAPVTTLLHVTNGTATSLGETGLGGSIAYWLDALHEGPVPALPLEELRPVRARFIAECGWLTYEQAFEEITARDRALERFADYDEVVLWFEHDLYDQLQLLQVLHWLASRARTSTRITLICAADYLGPMRPEHLAELFPSRTDVTREEFDYATRAWKSFTSRDPREIEALLRIRGQRRTLTPEVANHRLTFVASALHRHLRQFPSTFNGLSRTEQHIIEILIDGAKSFSSLFSLSQQREDAIFLGDSAFAIYLQRLCQCSQPLVKSDGAPYIDADAISWARQQHFSLTPVGEDVLYGRSDFIRLNGIDRWLGGVHLNGSEAQWRWDTFSGRLVAANEL